MVANSKIYPNKSVPIFGNVWSKRDLFIQNSCLSFCSIPCTHYKSGIISQFFSSSVLCVYYKLLHQLLSAITYVCTLPITVLGRLIDNNRDVLDEVHWLLKALSRGSLKQGNEGNESLSESKLTMRKMGKTFII